MLSKKILTLTFCSFLSSFSAFEDPMAAYQTSQRFIKTHPDFPSKNVVTILIQHPEEETAELGTGVVLAPTYVLTANHFKDILNPLANIYAKGWGWIPLQGGKLDEEEAKKNPDFFSCVERISFNGIVANSSSCTGSLSADDESLMSQVINFLALDISKGKEGNDIDVVLLRLNRPFLPLTNLPFQTTSHEPKKTIYGIGTKSSWNFANGERSCDGYINIHSKKPLSPLSSPEKGGTFFSFKGEEECLLIHHLFTQTVTPLPQRPLAVGFFEGFKEEDDETFKPQESLIYHNISPEDMPLFGLFTGGTSGGPVFALNEKKEFYLYGLISGTKGLMINDTQFYVNIVQTFPEELVKRINQIIFGE